MDLKNLDLKNDSLPRLPRLSPKEHLTLHLLVDRGEMGAQDLVRHSGGELKRGTIYVTLNRMDEKGYVESRHEKTPRLPGGPRRLFQAAEDGAQILHALELARCEMLVAELPEVGLAA